MCRLFNVHNSPTLSLPAPPIEELCDTNKPGKGLRNDSCVRDQIVAHHVVLDTRVAAPGESIMSENMHILRKLRLQLKTGFLRKEPTAYAFLKRYPPISRDAAPPVRKVERRNIPYLKLYEKAVAKNPLYADEKVYQAYWAHEPQALTLAKKQYEFMEKGDTETEAYEKAMTFVEEREGEAYENLKQLMSDLGASMGGVDVKLPFLATSDKDLEGTLSMFKDMLSNTPYDELELADQGEIDYYIQMKLLKWNEVERERRMKDPIFVRQFEKLRATLLPEIGISSDAATEKRHAEYKEKLLKFFDMNASHSPLCGGDLRAVCTQTTPKPPILPLCLALHPTLTNQVPLALRLGGRVLEELGHVATEAAVQLGLLILWSCG